MGSKHLSLPSPLRVVMTPYGGAWLLVLVVAGLVRGPALNSSLWLDELHTAWVVHDGWQPIAARAAAGNQAPLYFWAVAALQTWAGPSEWSLRGLSFVFGLALVGLLGHQVRVWTHSRLLGLTAASLVALDPHAVFFSGEARPYALLQFCGLLHVRCTVARAVCPTTVRRLTWIGGAWLLFYTHYTSLLLVLAEAIGSLLWAASRRRYRHLGMLAIDLLVILSGCAVSLPQLRGIAARRENWAQFVGQPSLTALWTLFPCSRYLLPAIGATAVWFLIRHRKPNAEVVPSRLVVGLGLASLWFWLPLTVAWWLTHFDIARLFLRRYLITAANGLFVMAVLPGVLWPGRKGRAAYAALLVTVAAGAAVGRGRSLLQHHGHEDWRAAVSAIQEDATAVDWPVFVRAGLIEDVALTASTFDPALREYCLFPVRGTYSLRAHRGPLEPLNSHHRFALRGDQMALIERVGGGWLIFRGTVSDTDALLAEWRRNVAQSGTLRLDCQLRRFPGMVVARCELQHESIAGVSADK